MPLGILQANLNHARRAQDLFLHSLAERGFGLGIAAEPYQVPEASPCWIGDRTGSVAITWRSDPTLPPCAPVEAGAGVVVVRWGPISVLGCYISPSVGLAQYEAFLDGVSACFRRQMPRPIIVAGDFNAKSTRWGSRFTNARGEALQDWAAALGLCLINTGSRSTLVRWESVLDLTWATPSAARMIVSWRVAECETLSDHLYIEVVLNTTRHGVLGRSQDRGDARPRRWALKKLSPDRLIAAVLAADWPCPGGEGRGITEEVNWFRGALRDACDFAMPRASPRPRRAAYWWCEEIAELRRLSVAARRRFTRARRRSGAERTAEAYEGFRTARNALSAAIRRAKARAWDELLRSLDADPWGRPYRLVMNKLRSWAPPVTESLEPQVLEGVLEALFPSEGPPFDAGGCQEAAIPWSEGLEVSEDEMAGVIRRLRLRGNKAPGPDGIPGRVWVLALAQLSGRLRRLFNSCLREGVFPPAWVGARLVLIPKGSKPGSVPSAYRPICLLDEAGKLLERVLANRLVQHLSRGGMDLHRDQYGFRGGRSTVDAILRVRSLAESIMKEGRVVLAVSLDIRNAFNTLPWSMVGEAANTFGLPPYMVEVLRSYFRDRWLEYPDNRVLLRRRDVYCGVPQGSVLGPTLWNLAYNRVLGIALPPGCSVVCYADDTLLLAGGKSWGDAVSAANDGVACVVRAIRGMGLQVAPQKTEALFMHKKRRGKHGAPPAEAYVTVGDISVRVGDRLKYLGLYLDAVWSFGGHFERLAPRAESVAISLSRLLPNLGGPDGRVRRLYANTVRAVALYGSPVWAGALMTKRRSKMLLRRVFRRVAIRVVRGYRTVSHTAATLLAGMPPVELYADMYAHVYARTRELGGLGVVLTPRVKAAVRLQARRRALERWDEHLSDPRDTSGRRVVEAIRPHLIKWVNRAGGEMSYRATQVFTGHGCFGSYLCRIGKEDSARCHHCDGDEDTAQHTLEICPAWAEERRVLVQIIGETDFSLSSIVAAMLESEKSWRAVSSFCEAVMLQKEKAERERERLPGGRRGDRGRGRAAGGAGGDAGSASGQDPPTPHDLWSRWRDSWSRPKDPPGWVDGGRGNISPRPPRKSAPAEGGARRGRGLGRNRTRPHRTPPAPAQGLGGLGGRPLIRRGRLTPSRARWSEPRWGTWARPRPPRDTTGREARGAVVPLSPS